MRNREISYRKFVTMLELLYQREITVVKQLKICYKKFLTVFYNISRPVTECVQQYFRIVV